MNTDLISLFSLFIFRMASAAKKNVEFYSSLEESLEIQSSDMEEDDTFDESLDKNVHVIECLDDEFIKNNYKDIQNIGKDGFVSVYSAQQRTESRRCALKVVPINMEKFAFFKTSKYHRIPHLYYYQSLEMHYLSKVKFRERCFGWNNFRRWKFPFL